MARRLYRKLIVLHITFCAFIFTVSHSGLTSATKNPSSTVSKTSSVKSGTRHLSTQHCKFAWWIVCIFRLWEKFLSGWCLKSSTKQVNTLLFTNTHSLSRAHVQLLCKPNGFIKRYAKKNGNVLALSLRGWYFSCGFSVFSLVKQPKTELLCYSLLVFCCWVFFSLLRSSTQVLFGVPKTGIEFVISFCFAAICEPEWHAKAVTKKKRKTNSRTKSAIVMRWHDNYHVLSLK